MGEAGSSSGRVPQFLFRAFTIFGLTNEKVHLKGRCLFSVDITIRVVALTWLFLFFFFPFLCSSLRVLRVSQRSATCPIPIYLFILHHTKR